MVVVKIIRYHKVFDPLKNMSGTFFFCSLFIPQLIGIAQAVIFSKSPTFFS